MYDQRILVNVRDATLLCKFRRLRPRHWSILPLTVKHIDFAIAVSMPQLSEVNDSSFGPVPPAVPLSDLVYHVASVSLSSHVSISFIILRTDGEFCDWPLSHWQLHSALASWVSKVCRLDSLPYSTTRESPEVLFLGRWISLVEVVLCSFLLHNPESHRKQLFGFYLEMGHQGWGSLKSFL